MISGGLLVVDMLLIERYKLDRIDIAKAELVAAGHADVGVADKVDVAADRAHRAVKQRYFYLDALAYVGGK